jgi:hypothetical protein
MLWLAGRKGWLVGGQQSEGGENIPGKDLCFFPRAWDTGGFYLTCFGAPCIVLAIPGFVSGERGEEMGGGCERESSARDGCVS